MFIGDTVSIKISQDEYESSLVACRNNLHGRLTLHKGDSPLTTKALKLKLNDLWPSLKNWSMLPLGKGFFEFNFQSVEDMRKILALGAVNLKLMLKSTVGQRTSRHNIRYKLMLNSRVLEEEDVVRDSFRYWYPPYHR